MRPAGRTVHRASTLVLSLLMIAIGLAMLVSTVARGGGPLALGILLGIGFAAAGAARLWLLRKT
jgi:hypothetical protein